MVFTMAGLPRWIFSVAIKYADVPAADNSSNSVNMIGINTFNPNVFLTGGEDVKSTGPDVTTC
jgi:hypothetical protein